MIERARDYVLTKADASELMGVSVLPDEFRRKILALKNKNELIRLFSAFVGLANSVVANNREFIEEYLIMFYKEWPQTAEKVNLPTIQGALTGVDVALPVSKGMCGTCAYRLGTIANQSPITSLDAKTCAEDSQTFMCHETLDEKGEPQQKCVGYSKSKIKAI